MAIKTWPAEVNSVRTATVLSPDEVQLPEEIFIVPGAHLDFGWCAGISECLAYADELIKGAIDTITGPEPDYRFTVEYAAFLRHFVTRFPEYLPTVKQLVKERKIETTAAMVGYMEDVLDGEIMVREIVHAKRFRPRRAGLRLAHGPAFRPPRPHAADAPAPRQSRGEILLLLALSAV